MLWRKKKLEERRSPDDILSPLPPTFRAVLISMYSGEPQQGLDGERHRLDPGTRISCEQGMWMYRLCCDIKPKTSLEIGLAYGYSTIYFLAAIHENGIGYHTAVDPYQNHWHGIGRLHSRNLSMKESFRYIEEKSTPALVHFADQGEKFDLIFIDGNHRFDDVLVDFTLSAELCPREGCIILDDMWMPAIRRVAAFIRSNRHDFEEIKTSLPNIAAFRRIDSDTRDWFHYVEFSEPYHMPPALRRLTPAFLRRGAKAILRSAKS